jgi:hypothetical protein
VKLAQRRRAIVAVLMVLSLLFLAATAVNADDLKLQVLFPGTVTPGVQFNITIKAYNFSDKEISFNRVVVGYANPDMTIKGPYVSSTTERKVPITTDPNQPYIFTVPFKILTTQPTGTLVPMLVTLWYNQYTTGYSRGAGAGAARILIQ